MPSDSPLVPSLLNNIGFAITTRYERSKRPTDIEWAIDALGECVGDQTLPEGRSILWWTNLGNALRLRYHELSRDMEDLNKAIRLFEAVVRETPAHSPNLAVYRQNLANTVIDRMRDSSAPDHGDLDRGIGLLQKAVTEFGGPPTDLPSIYANLGMALMVRNQQNLDQVDHTAAIDAFRTSIKLGTDVRISQAVHASVLWGDWAFERKAWEEAIEPYECARAASEQLFRIQLARAHKEIILRSTREVHVKMAFALARVQRPEDAVVALESGIGRMLSEALEQGRRDLDSLRETRNAEIYDQYRQVAQELAAACGLDSASGRDAAEAGVLASSIGELQADLDRIVGQIGELPGFEGFLRDLTLDDIRSVCDVPLVYVLYTIHGGLALIVRENQGQGVIALDLPALTTQWVYERVRDHLASLRRFQRSPKQSSDLDIWKRSVDHLLEDLTTEVVEPISEALIGATHAIFIPVGILQLLPVHAAGTISTDNSKNGRLRGEEEPSPTRRTHGRCYRQSAT